MTEISSILALLLLSVTVQSSFYFLKVLRVNFQEWICFNACAPSNLVFLLGFVVFLLTKNRTVLHIAILPMFFYGVLGLFVFPWKGINIIPQIGHIIMTLNIFCLIFVTFSTADYKSATIGTLLGIALFSIFIAFQQNFAATHQQDLKRVLGISLYSSVPQDPNPDEPELKRKNNE